jgi:hypothetical protein
MDEVTLEAIKALLQSVGSAIFGLIQRILPQARLPADLVDPVGFLTVLTILVLLAGVARRIAWAVVGIGWALIVLRIGLSVIGR